jgi:hypothetical protein
LRAHTLVLPEEPGGEGPWARLAAQRSDADLTEHPLTARDLADELPRLARAIDQPSIDGINTYFIAKYARSAGTVGPYQALEVMNYSAATIHSRGCRRCCDGCGVAWNRAGRAAAHAALKQ